MCAPPRAPGAVPGDLVLHCGESTEGFHLSNLVVVDVASGWIELEPIWGVGAVRVGPASNISTAGCPSRSA